MNKAFWPWSLLQPFAQLEASIPPCATAEQDDATGSRTERVSGSDAQAV